MSPTVLRIGSFRFFFYSGDRSEPPHVHIERDDKIAKVWLDPVRLQRNSGFRPAEIREILQLAWYPRLMHATNEERQNWRLIGKGEGIHWEDIDEDISVEHLLLGIPSGESQSSLQRWLEGRKK